MKLKIVGSSYDCTIKQKIAQYSHCDSMNEQFSCVHIVKMTTRLRIFFFTFFFLKVFYSKTEIELPFDEAMHNLRAAPGTTQSLELCLNTDMRVLSCVTGRRMSLVRRLSRWRQCSRRWGFFIQIEGYAVGSDGKQLHSFPPIP